MESVCAASESTFVSTTTFLLLRAERSPKGGYNKDSFPGQPYEPLDVTDEESILSMSEMSF
jgi:hypothetical protein